MSPVISINNLKKSYNQTEVFEDFSLDVEQGEITAIFGPNGSGKSTLLNILAGISTKDSGRYDINGFDHFSFSYIFQNYRESLLPWRTLYENVALPLQIQGISDVEIRKRIDELEKMFETKFNWGQYPYELSGGQQQIIAFMRGLIANPKILFIDEPFSALDYENNLRLRDHLQKYYLTFKPTIILITHDIEEAVYLAEKIVVFSKKPTRVLETIENTIAYPRTIASLKAEEFHQVKDGVLSAFERATNL